MPFFIFALPRSRTLWTANLLTWGPAHCYHELVPTVTSRAQFRDVMAFTSDERRFVGNCGSDNLLLAEEIFAWFPEASSVYLRRDLGAIQASLARLGIAPLSAETLALGADCEDLVSRRGGLILDVDDWTPESTHRLWRHCLPALPFPAERNEQLEFTRAEITGKRWAQLAAWAATPNSEALLHAAGTARPPRTRASFVPHPSPFAQ